VLAEYPGIKFVELGKVLGERWRALTPDQKKQYEEMATQDKMRFQMEMRAYQARQDAAEDSQQMASDGVTQDQFAPYHDPTGGSGGYDAYTQHQIHHHDPYSQAYGYKTE
jgi:hypothetical protein